MIKSEIIHFLDTLTRHLKNEGCKIIGHIKGKIDSAENGVLFFNQTAFDSLPDVGVNVGLLYSVIGSEEHPISRMVTNILCRDFKWLSLPLDLNASSCQSA